jgi:hypothetical protein
MSEQEQPKFWHRRTIDDRSITEEIALNALLALAPAEQDRVISEALALRSFPLEIAVLELGDEP